ncbi:hypothetical protein IFR04_007773 [Cadophora malorum]|uniref:Uncharacterized protein n=1 Tax=Cadophora malorum TaxID=108018 RepID=A0A8H7W668_9HELO|nr:hypothetical protein IFR04_007773 [Cadophora malorum]
MRFQPLLLLTACLTGTLALPGPVPVTLSTVPEPVKTPAGDCSQSGLLCIAEMHVVYNQTTGTCGCEWIPGFGPALAVTDRQDVDPKTCPTVRCKEKYRPVYYPGKTHCACEPDMEYPDPSTCPLIKCTSSTRPVYHPETKSCSCDPIPLECPNSIFCAAGCHKIQDPLTKKCSCKVTNPIPKTCPQFKCLENHHVIYHPDTDKCGCDPDCPDLMCIAEQRVTYNYTTNSCFCKYIPGLEPSLIQDRAANADASSPLPTPTKAILPPVCSKIMCISEKHPVYNKTTGNCKCEWIPGFGPPTPIKPKPTSPTSSGSIEPTPIKPGCPDTYCISEQRPTYNATTGRCTCEWIPGLKPSEPSTLISARAEPTRYTSPGCSGSGIMCIPEKQPVYNETAGRCECEWMDIFKPPIVSWTSPDPSAVPTPLPTPTRFTPITPRPTLPPIGPSCLKPGTYCVPEMQPVYNATSGKCECEWIPGLGPVTIKS